MPEQLFTDLAEKTPPDNKPAQEGSPEELKSTNTLGIIVFPAFDWAISKSHPEREERLLYTQDQLREEGLFDIAGISEYKAESASFEDVALAHFCPPGFASVVEEPHLISAGCAISAGKMVMDKTVSKSFSLARPPGHHAMKIVHGGRGFCAVNNEAIMIARLRKDYGPLRIAVVDTDCHHGDGTQDIYWHDPDTLFISLHQDGRTLYPGSGFLNEAGGPKAQGSCINIPLPPNTGDDGYLYTVRTAVVPMLQAFKPDLVINSAGQDNHFSDPITNMLLTARGYAEMVEMINPDIAVLEGGYSIQGALPYVNLAVILAMAGLDYSNVVEPSWPDGNEHALKTSPKALELIKRTCAAALQIFSGNDVLNHGYKLSGGIFKRERNIYYDTCGINETQREELIDCENCSGLLTRRSKSDFSPWSTCLCLPGNACEKCLSAAADIKYKAEKTGELVEFFNRQNNEYQRSK